METTSKLKGKIMIIALIPITILVSGLLWLHYSGFFGGSALRVTHEGISKQVLDLANMRYTGYKDEELKRLELYCTDEVAEQLRDELFMEYHKNYIMGVTGLVGSYKNTKHLGMSDLIQEVQDENGEYRWQVDMSKLPFNYPNYDTVELQLFDGTVTFNKDEVPQGPELYKGNPNYLMEFVSCTAYNKPTGQLLVIELQSSPVTNVLNNKQHIELEVDKKGKISSIDTSQLTQQLQYS